MTPSSWSLRSPGKNEIDGVYNLMVRSDMAEYGELDSDMEDLVYDWEGIDLAQNAWVAQSAKGKLIGYAAVLPWMRNLRLDIYLDPDHRESGLGEALLARCEARAVEMAQGDKTGRQMRQYVASSNRPARRRLEAAGFKPSMYVSQMQIELAEEPPVPDWPDGVSLRTAVPGVDDAAIHQLIEEAFARPGRTGTTLEQWRKLMIRPEIFHSELWLLAEADGELVGACLGFIYPDLGWVRQLAVRARWRRRGLGKALLHHAFRLFRERNLPQAGLTVDSVRPDAFAFYQQVGMTQIRQYIAYDKTVKAA